MLNAPHVLETALLLLAAFLIGAVLGSLARLAAMRLARKPAQAAALVAPAPVVATEPALVSAPVIDPLPNPAVPQVPENVPTPDFAATMLALANAPLPDILKMPSIAPLPKVEGAAPVSAPAEPMQPARTAGETTSGRRIISPLESAHPVQPAVAPDAPTAEVIPFPVAEPVVVETAPTKMADVTAELESLLNLAVAASAEAPAADVSESLAEPAPVESPIIDPPSAVESPSAETTEPMSLAASPVVAVVEEAAPAQPDSVEQEAQPADITDIAIAEPSPEQLEEPATPVAEALPAEAVVAAVEPPKSATPSPVRSIEEEEAAAMRAIEGNWSPRRGAAKKVGRSTEMPEGVADAAVKASGIAVAAATEAANAVVADVEVDPNRPVGTAVPRQGGGDDLTHVIGILPIIETALNKLGIYHFDQVADLSDEHVAWIETHLGIAGRIGREHWREQSRELAAHSTRKVAAES